ncbi:MAG: hypothetical protein DRP58_06720 [Spirochaetes bacterium]|nr:MAG: hypothetical protein DRP58_06720 [Spirochaetota bacterium]
MKKNILFLILIFVVAYSTFSLDVYKKIIQPGETLVGTPYRSGGVSPSGFDCSGFVTYLYKKYVPGLPRLSRNMAGFGIPVKRSAIVPGDLIFFATGSSAGNITHVAIYIGQNSILHSISNGPNRGVTITSLSSRYWNKRYFSAVRVLENSVSEISVNNDGAGGQKQAKENISEKTNVTNLQFAKGKYTGEILAGEPEWQGVLAMNNGDRYEGLFKSGLFEGEGTYFWADGRKQTGMFKGGKFQGTENKGNNYMLKKDSPWETWDGIVEGDFKLYLQQDKDAFKEWKKNN